MKLVSVNVDGLQLDVAHLDLWRVVFLVQPCMHLEARRGASCRDQIDDDLECLQRHSPPVAGNVAKQLVLNLVPFTRARRVMANLDGQTCDVCEALEFESPKPRSRAVASPAVGSDQEAIGFRKSLSAEFPPPQQDRGYGELGGIMTDSDTDQRLVVLQVVDAVRNRLTQLLLREIMSLDFERLL